MKTFKKISRKISVLTMAMLILQPLLLIGVAPQKAFGKSDKIVLQAEQDAFAKEVRPDRNFNNEELHVRSHEDYNQRSFIQFDLSGVTLEQDVNLVDATLSLYMYQAPSETRTYEAFRVDEVWNEDTLKWNNKPETALISTDSTNPGTAGEWVDWDVTTDVLDFLNGDSTNKGWVIKDWREDADENQIGKFRSSDYVDQSFAPKLIINRSSLPTSNITTPTADTSYNGILGDLQEWPGEISGTANGNLGTLEKVEVAIQNEAGEYWDFDPISGAWENAETWEVSNLDLVTKDWDLAYTPNLNGVFSIQTIVTEKGNGVPVVGDSVEGVVYDTERPEFDVVVTPTSATQNDKTVDIEVVPSEDLKGQFTPGSNSVINQIRTLGTTYNVKLTVNDTEGEPFIKYLDENEDGKFIYTHTIESTDEKTVTVEVVGTDLAGNEGEGNGEFTLDNVAPGNVTDLESDSGDATVELTWVNPVTVNDDFAGVMISRTDSDGNEEVFNPGNVTGFTDTGLTNGEIYTYDVYPLDISGNIGEKATVQGSPVAPVVASIAIVPVPDPVVTSTITTEQFPVEEGEIKAEIKEDEDRDSKDVEVKDDRKLPVWGILFLLILAAIGGYLFYVQNPEKFGGDR